MKQRVKKARRHYALDEDKSWRRESFYEWAESVTQMGKWRKTRVGDCGCPGCWMCHPDKFDGKRRQNKRLAAIRFELEASE